VIRGTKQKIIFFLCVARIKVFHAFLLALDLRNTRSRVLEKQGIALLRIGSQIAKKKNFFLSK